jgi:DNA-directed RNA polymerase specialized sigma24 family protein
MSEPAHIQFHEQQANLNATGEDVRETFSEDLNSLYQLSFLLTRDHEKAERCFVVGIEHLLRGNRAFNQWAHAWSKRIVVENAIREVKPRPGVAHSYSSAIVFPYGGQLSTPPGGHFEPEAILALEDFERFVFVLSVLDHYSEQDCALFLDCSVLKIRETRTRALEKLIDSLHITFLHNEVFTRETSR